MKKTFLTSKIAQILLPNLMHPNVNVSIYTNQNEIIWSIGS